LVGAPTDPIGNLKLVASPVICKPFVVFIAGVPYQLATTVPVTPVFPT
jgi:hypothetical protein